ncbi:MAG TPA: hypothetical protein VD930_06375 [Gemmatimonadales bacterium]|nr:hypothetical protein [Gemmatimonadales bacterium]
MIVYRDQRTTADPRHLLRQLSLAANHAGVSAPNHDDALELVIETGVLEAAVSDALFPEHDGIHPMAQSLRQASVQAGHVFWHTWNGRSQEARRWGERLASSLRDVPEFQLPPSVEVSVPEGYAYYAVYPETYLEAARRFYNQTGPSDVLCLGLRSIGTSLSAVVAAALEELGCRVRTFTLRPRGHPFSRRPSVSSELAARIRERSDSYALLIDEGPGISGSSLAGTAAMLQAWGHKDDHIVLFPSWETDGAGLASEEARRQWPLHPQLTCSFEEVWVSSGRLSEAFPGDLRDLSAGAWREEVYRDTTAYPAVHPQHERRKYLLMSAAQETKLLSFAGLGHRALQKKERLERVAEAGFTVRPERLVHGFLLRRFVPGTPMSTGLVDGELVERAAAYLAYLCREHATEPSVTDASLRELVSVNVAEGLQNPMEVTLSRALPVSGWVERPVALDGRMLIHEWIRTPQGFIKVDAMDHHDDHFFPGCQDIAWDVAGTAFELDLDPQGRAHLVDRYRRLSGDRGIARRLPHYAIAYLSFRLGYSTLAASVLDQTADGARFNHQARRYARLLTSELEAPPARWSD